MYIYNDFKSVLIQADKSKISLYCIALLLIYDTSYTYDNILSIKKYELMYKKKNIFSWNILLHFNNPRKEFFKKMSFLNSLSFTYYDLDFSLVNCTISLSLNLVSCLHYNFELRTEVGAKHVFSKYHSPRNV